MKKSTKNIILAIATLAILIGSLSYTTTGCGVLAATSDEETTEIDYESIFSTYNEVDETDQPSVKFGISCTNISNHYGTLEAVLVEDEYMEEP